MVAADPAAGTSEFPGGDIGAGLCGIIPGAAESEGRGRDDQQRHCIENYMSSQLEQNDFGDTTLILTFDQAAKEKVLEMEGAQNVEVLTDLTGDELEILDPYGAELVTYGICYETLSNTIHKLAELLNEENMEV